MKRMLINATHDEELRVAIVDGQRLLDLDVENRTREKKKANIYKAKITRVEPSLEAAFVNYGADRHGFLPFKEISRSYYSEAARNKNGRPSISEAIKEGQEIIIQVEKEERGNKGAALTTFVSLAGRYLVLMPNNPRAGGVSRRIEGENRSDLRDALSELKIPDGMGLIVRTAGVGRSAEELQWDLDYLTQLWQSIEKSSAEKPAPFLIYQESNAIIRALRDYLRSDIGEIMVDDPTLLAEAQEFMQQVMPHNLPKLKRYDDETPLFSRYQIESQIESAFQREVRLPAGGSIVVDPTEALIAIDINSARATKGTDIEDTALKTNLEAAEEIARQLRLRDMGGLVVIDFIDMRSNRNQRAVENRLRDALKVDRARVQIGRISRFGLLEMSRQRLRPSLGETSGHVCPRCDGSGSIRGVESLALSILRIIEEQAMKENTGQITAEVPVEVGTYLLNEKRDILSSIEARQKVRMILIPNPAIETPKYEIRRLRTSEMPSGDVLSYQQATPPEPVEAPAATKAETVVRPEQPAVNTLPHSTPAPAHAPARTSNRAPAPQKAPPVATPAPTQPKSKGFISKLLSMVTGGSDKAEEPKATPAQPTNQRSSGNRSNNRGGRNSNNRNQRNDRGGRDNRSGGRNGQNRGRSSGDNRNSNTNNRNQQRSGNQQDNTQNESRGQSRGGQQSRNSNQGQNRNQNQGRGRNEARNHDNNQSRNQSRHQDQEQTSGQSQSQSQGGQARDQAQNQPRGQSRNQPRGQSRNPNSGNRGPRNEAPNNTISNANVTDENGDVNGNVIVSTTAASGAPQTSENRGPENGAPENRGEGSRGSRRRGGRRRGRRGGGANRDNENVNNDTNSNQPPANEAPSTSQDSNQGNNQGNNESSTPAQTRTETGNDNNRQADTANQAQPSSPAVTEKPVSSNPAPAPQASVANTVTSSAPPAAASPSESGPASNTPGNTGNDSAASSDARPSNPAPVNPVPAAPGQSRRINPGSVPSGAMRSKRPQGNGNPPPSASAPTQDTAASVKPVEATVTTTEASQPAKPAETRPNAEKSAKKSAQPETPPAAKPATPAPAPAVTPNPVSEKPVASPAAHSKSTEPKPAEPTPEPKPTSSSSTTE